MAKFLATGVLRINLPEPRAVIKGRILEGVLKAGMFVEIRLNSSLSLAVEIESVESVDYSRPEDSEIGLVIAPDPTADPVETAEWIEALNIYNEELVVSDEAPPE